ncbi:hypothetical protein T484DRAFT_1826852, partial [Baffinella frigidus]
FFSVVATENTVRTVFQTFFSVVATENTVRTVFQTIYPRKEAVTDELIYPRKEAVTDELVQCILKPGRTLNAPKDVDLRMVG